VDFNRRFIYHVEPIDPVAEAFRTAALQGKRVLNNEHAGHRTGEWRNAPLHKPAKEGHAT
jgi:hypothetical protein